MTAAARLTQTLENTFELQTTVQQTLQSTAQSVARPIAQAEFKVKRSRFLGRLWNVSSEEEAAERLRETKREFRNASHWVFAYVIGGIMRSGDNGEPAGTAGVPVLNVLRSANLDNVCVVVTRWFGGVKLGKDGLADAYRECAEQTLKSAVV